MKKTLQNNLKPDVNELKNMIDVLYNVFKESNNKPFLLKDIVNKEYVLKTISGNVDVKTLSKNKNFQIIEYSHDGASIIPNHVHEHSDEYFLVIKGKVIILETNTNKQNILNTGEFLKISKNIPHSGFAEDETILLTILIPSEEV